jgi:uncharacterized protein (TIGR02646 family)
MLHLRSKPLPKNVLVSLEQKQKEINEIRTGFADKVKKANSLWDNKGPTKNLTTTFGVIKDRLKKMCVGDELCCYCERNEATDIEHIFPKKIFPNLAFFWKNYVLICGKCNSHRKKEHFKVFNPIASNQVQDVTPPKEQYIASPTEDNVFINPRTENPMDYLRLDLTAQTFHFIEKDYNIQSRAYQKANYTIELLVLNNPALVNARKKAAQDFIGLLEKYRNVKCAMSFDELKKISDFPIVDETTTLLKEKHRLLFHYKNEILTHQQPTVWKEMLRQRTLLLKTDALLKEVPEALKW